jgi:hypothetical protein
MYKTFFVRTPYAQVLLSCFLGFVSLFLFQSCEKDKVSNDEKVVDASLSISKITALSPTSFRIVGKIEKGSADILEYGFYYSAGGEVKIDESTKIQFSGKTHDGSFDEEVKGLKLDESYGNPAKIYVKAYVTDQKKTIFSKIISVNMPEIKAASLNKSEGKSGDLINISGSFFVSNPANITMMFGGVTAKITLSDTAFTAEIPSGIEAHHGELIPVELNINNVSKVITNEFKILAHVKDYNPKSGVFGNVITLSGDNMPSSVWTKVGFYYDDHMVYFSKTEGLVPYFHPKSDKIKISVSVDEHERQLLPDFTLLKPEIISISPISIIPGTLVTVKGINFPIYIEPQVNEFFGSIGGVNVELFKNREDEVSFYVKENVKDGEYPFVYNVGPHQAISSQKIEVRSPSISSLSHKEAVSGTPITIKGEFTVSTDYSIYLDDKLIYYVSTTNPEELRFVVPDIAPTEGILYLGNGSRRISMGEFKILTP